VTDAKLYVEGGSVGADSKEIQARCREGFKKLLLKIGLTNRLPRIIACGSRNEAYDSFKTEHLAGKMAYVALLVDSEALTINGENPWGHLKIRDDWNCPTGATDDQVFLMTTCMETWIIADKDGLSRFYEKYKKCLRSGGLPSTVNLEAKDSHVVQNALLAATQDCSNAYMKNKRSLEALATVDPAVLQSLLPAFARMERILKNKL